MGSKSTKGNVRPWPLITARKLTFPFSMVTSFRTLSQMAGKRSFETHRERNFDQLEPRPTVLSPATAPPLAPPPVGRGVLMGKEESFLAPLRAVLPFA